MINRNYNWIEQQKKHETLTRGIAKKGFSGRRSLPALLLRQASFVARSNIPCT
jgi:hypothetical protein